MFKIIYRIFFILLVAALVAGGLYYFFNTGAGQALIQNARGGFEPGAISQGPFTADFGNSAAFRLSSQAGFEGGRGLRGEGGSPLALLDVVKNAGTIGVITTWVVLLQKGWGRARRLLRRKSLMTAAR